MREPAEFAAGHVPGAVNIPRGVLEFRIYKELGYPKKVDTSRKIYVQCQTGGRASLAAASLEEDRLQESRRRDREHGGLGEGRQSAGEVTRTQITQPRDEKWKQDVEDGRRPLVAAAGFAVALSGAALAQSGPVSDCLRKSDIAKYCARHQATAPRRRGAAWRGIARSSRPPAVKMLDVTGGGRGRNRTC